MKRRSFLTLLGLSPLALKAGPLSAATQPAILPVLPVASGHPSYGLVADRTGRCIIGKITNADGSLVIDFENGRMEIRGDLVCDGQLSGKVVEVDPIDGWDDENQRYVDDWGFTGGEDDGC